LEGLRSNGCI